MPAADPIKKPKPLINGPPIAAPISNPAPPVIVLIYFMISFEGFTFYIQLTSLVSTSANLYLASKLIYS